MGHTAFTKDITTVLSHRQMSASACKQWQQTNSFSCKSFSLSWSDSTSTKSTLNQNNECSGAHSFLSNVCIHALGQHGFVHPSLWFMTQYRLPINNLHVYCTSPWWLQAEMGLWTGGRPAVPNQRCMQAAAAAVVTLKSYAADLLWPSAAAKRCVSQTDLTDNTSWESGEYPTWMGQHFLQHLI